MEINSQDVDRVIVTTLAILTSRVIATLCLTSISRPYPPLYVRETFLKFTEFHVDHMQFRPNDSREFGGVTVFVDLVRPISLYNLQFGYAEVPDLSTDFMAVPQLIHLQNLMLLRSCS